MKSEIPWSLLAGFIIMASGVILPSCTYNRVQLPSGKTFSIERVESSPIYISWVYAEEEDNEMIVNGLLRSHFTYTQGTGHVDVAVISPGGELLGQTSVDYAPKTIPPGTRSKETRFKALFPFIPPEGSRIRVALHESQKLKEGDLDCGNNRAAEEGAV